MAFGEVYRQQVGLLVRVLPLVAAESDFALKGGTAINLFHRDLPRLSVDIDLAYLPLSSRSEALAAIDAAMKRLAAAIGKTVPGARISEGRLPPEGAVVKLIVRTARVQIKLEVTPVLRGAVFPAERIRTRPAVEAAFGFAEVNVLSFADLYAGKIVAAFDRQHPRDLFDVRELLANEGVSEALRRAFLVYMVSHGRPMAEVLAPPRKDIAREFERGFQGMTANPIALEALVAAREALVEAMVVQMPQAHRRFLMGFERGEPDWSLIDLAQAAQLPAVRWRQRNLDSLPPERRAALVAALRDVLYAGDDSALDPK
jgi:predicted nucleotidyltransferase component of viral defense system